MIVLSGADLVLPDRVLTAGTLTIDAGRIVDIRADSPSAPSAFAFHGHTIVPGFIDVHVHGVDGIDVFAGPDAVSRVAASLPRYGVTSFCPTTVACPPAELREVLGQVRRCRETPAMHAARVLPAHLESNFISAAYRGAQPLACLRTADWRGTPPMPAAGEAFTGRDIRDVIEACAPDVGIVTLAPELDGALDLIGWLIGLGVRVSLGHSAATWDQALAAIAAGATQATHIFNGMPPFHHRTPGLAGAVLQAPDVAVEVICDGVHVHPGAVRMVVAAKGPSRVMAITDGTAAAGLAPGTRVSLGGQAIVATETCARLDDGTMAGSVLTMDEAFRRLTGQFGISPVDASLMCATTPARELGLVGYGLLSEGAVADLVVLDARGQVVQTYVGGRLVFTRSTPGNSADGPAV
jgi:N-acetylglucosamine-6-phosphate deacetylase